MKPIRVLAGASVALVATAAIAIPSAASLAAASARSGAAQGSSPAVSGTEHFQLMTTSATATTVPVIAYGVFTAAGVDHVGNNVDTLVFGHRGSLERQVLDDEAAGRLPAADQGVREDIALDHRSRRWRPARFRPDAVAS
jgi:hypothetical protein